MWLCLLQKEIYSGYLRQNVSYRHYVLPYRKWSSSHRNEVTVNSEIEIFNKEYLGQIQKRKNNDTECRSSHRRCSIEKSVLKNFAKITGKQLCQSLFFNKVTGLRTAILFKKRLWKRYFPVHFSKFSKTPFLQNTSWQLLLWLNDSNHLACDLFVFSYQIMHKETNETFT